MANGFRRGNRSLYQPERSLAKLDNPSAAPSINPSRAELAPSSVKKAGNTVVAISCPTSEQSVASPMPNTVELSHPLGFVRGNDVMRGGCFGWWEAVASGHPMGAAQSGDGVKICQTKVLVNLGIRGGTGSANTGYSASAVCRRWSPLVEKTGENYSEVLQDVMRD